METDTQAEQPQTAAPKKVTKIPALNPYIAPNMICSNRMCLKPMTPTVSTEKGGEPLLRYDCESCNYSFFASLIHAQGQCKQLGAAKANPPEALVKA